MSDAADPQGAPAPVEVPAGFRVGRWTVGERLGAGAWGTVHAARTDEPGDGPAEAALKFLPSAALSPGEAGHLADVVERELRCAAEGGEGLVPVLEVLTAEAEAPPLHGAHVLVMERARGSLADVVAADDAPPEERARLLGEAWGALRAVHARGWVHGDVKPANALVLRDGSVRLADLGLAAELDGTHAYAPQPASVDFVGPEWWDERVGADGSRVRRARDLWAFGVVVHLVLSGRYPFDGQSPRARAFAARAYAGGGEPLRLAAGIPAGWRPVLADLLRADAEEREAAAPDVDARVRALARGDEPTSGRSARRRWSPGRRGAAALAAATVLAVGIPVAVVVAGGDTGTAEGEGETQARRGDLRRDAAVPRRYRARITEAARRCDEPAVTPALIAGMLEVESGFDADLRDEGTGEFGIARWTPSVFAQWAADADGGGASVRSPADSIRTLGIYLCQIGTRFPGAEGDDGLLRAAAYRGGSQQVVAAAGVPSRLRAYTTAVGRARARFAVADPG